jgi:hypothetical protein
MSAADTGHELNGRQSLRRLGIAMANETSSVLAGCLYNSMAARCSGFAASGNLRTLARQPSAANATTQW